MAEWLKGSLSVHETRRKESRAERCKNWDSLTFFRERWDEEIWKRYYIIAHSSPRPFFVLISSSRDRKQMIGKNDLKGNGEEIENTGIKQYSE